MRVVERGCRAAGGLAGAELVVPLVSGFAGVRVVDGAAFVLTSPLTAVDNKIHRRMNEN